MTKLITKINPSDIMIVWIITIFVIGLVAIGITYLQQKANRME